MSCAIHIGEPGRRPSVDIDLSRLSDVELLRNALASRGLAREKKGLDQLTVAANRHAGEPPVPLTLGAVCYR